MIFDIYLYFVYINVFILYENFKINFYKQISRLNTFIYQHLHFFKQIFILRIKFSDNLYAFEKNLKYMTYIISICIKDKKNFLLFFKIWHFWIIWSNRSNLKFLSSISIRHSIFDFNQSIVTNFDLRSLKYRFFVIHIIMIYRFFFFVWFFRFFDFDFDFSNHKIWNIKHASYKFA